MDHSKKEGEAWSGGLALDVVERSVRGTSVIIFKMASEPHAESKKVQGTYFTEVRNCGHLGLAHPSHHGRRSKRYGVKSSSNQYQFAG
jgi:hypothetical protein